MASTEIFVSAGPDAVFDVLGDARTYAEWVVGSREVRAADEDWPAPGSALDHSIGKAPIVIRDDTTVVDARPPVLLELRARARPLPTARITLRLRPEGDGTRVTMSEEPTNPLVNRLGGRLLDAAIGFRNRESLRRLRALAEGTAPRPDGVLPRRHGSDAA